jgi:hypothetical protein
MRPWLGVMVLLAIACSPAPPPPYEPAPTAAETSNAIAYGGAGQLTAAEANLIRNLAWPQTYDDIKNAVGLPAYRTAEGDIYKLPDGGEITILYDGKNATGYRD